MIDGCYGAPFVGCWIGAHRWQVGELEAIGGTKLCVTGGARTSDLEKSQCASFADCWSDRMTMNTKSNKLFECDRQLAVFLTAVAQVFEFNAIEHAPC